LLSFSRLQLVTEKFTFFLSPYGHLKSPWGFASRPCGYVVPAQEIATCRDTKKWINKVKILFTSLIGFLWSVWRVSLK
jgi:hypothetical protein